MVVVSLNFDRLDLDDGKFLAMALLALVALALLLLEDDDLLAATILEDLGGDRGARQGGVAHLVALALARGQDIGNFDGRAGLRVPITVHHEDVALGYGELLALGFDRRFHK